MREAWCPSLSVALLLLVSAWSFFVNEVWGSIRRWSALNTSLELLVGRFWMVVNPLFGMDKFWCKILIACDFCLWLDRI